MSCNCEYAVQQSEALQGVDTLRLVIESAVRNADPANYEAIVTAMDRVRIALRRSAAPSVAQDTYTAPVPAGYTHALDCAYKASPRNHCTCGYVAKEGA